MVCCGHVIPCVSRNGPWPGGYSANPICVLLFPLVETMVSKREQRVAKDERSGDSVSHHLVTQISRTSDISTA